MLPRKLLRFTSDYTRLETSLANHGYAIQHNLDTYEDRGWVIRSIVPHTSFWIDLFMMDEDPRSKGCDNESPKCAWVHYLHNHEYHPTQRKRCVGVAFNFRLAAWLNTTLWIPNDPIEYLEDMYGYRWRTPKKAYPYFRICHEGDVDIIYERDKKGQFFTKLLLPLGSDVVDLQTRLEYQHAGLISAAWEREWRSVHAAHWEREWMFAWQVQWGCFFAMTKKAFGSPLIPHGCNIVHEKKCLAAVRIWYRVKIKTRRFLGMWSSELVPSKNIPQTESRIYGIFAYLPRFSSIINYTSLLPWWRLSVFFTTCEYALYIFCAVKKKQSCC